jgi:hypothetical protein
LFGKLWTELAGSFVEQADVLGALIVRYEGLKDGLYEPIESYLGFKLNRDVTDVRPHDGPKSIEVIPQVEMAELGDELHELAGRLGYAPHGISVETRERTRRLSHMESDEADGLGGTSHEVANGGNLERARQAGFKIYADTRIRLMHYGNYGYSWEDAGMELQRYRTFHFHTK